MSVTVDIQRATEDPAPEDEDLRSWAELAVADRSVEISLRLVSEPEMVELNQRYRGRAGSTNVLSFPAEFPADLPCALLGDIVICAAVVQREAAQQHKAVAHHWAHMVIHGTLHLLGYNHEQEAEAVTMEALETRYLAELNIPCPYEAVAIAAAAGV